MIYVPNQGPAIMYNAEPLVVGASQSVLPQKDGSPAIFVTGGVPLQLYLATILLTGSISGEVVGRYASAEPSLNVRGALVLANQLITEYNMMAEVKAEAETEKPEAETEE